jgi:hypothetical protein
MDKVFAEIKEIDLSGLETLEEEAEQAGEAK